MTASALFTVTASWGDACRIGAAAAGVSFARLNQITLRIAPAFGSFAALITAKGGYRPSIRLDLYGAEAVALCAAYDAAQAARGDERLAYRAGTIAEHAERQAAKAARQAMRAECQICAGIFATTRRGGVLVTHGFSVHGKAGRFGGWRTGDCPGVGHLPYALACDALPPAIRSAVAFAKAREAQALELSTGTPTLAGRVVLNTRTGRHEKRPDITPDRPDYESHRAARVNGLRGEAAEARATAKALEARLDAWRAPATAAA